MSIEDSPATDSGIFHNPPKRKIKLQWRRDGTSPDEKDISAVRELLLAEEQETRKDRVEALTELLLKLDDWAHRVLLEEIRTSDPRGDYIFAQGPCQMASGPEGGLVFRGIWKVVADSDSAEKPRGWRFESAALPSYKAEDADSVLRNTVEQRMRIASLLQAVLSTQKENSSIKQQLGVALLKMYQLGWKACQVSVRDREPDAARGTRVLNAAKKAHIQTYGTTEQKQRKWAEYQMEVNRLCTLHPKWSAANIYRTTARKFGVTSKTICRHTRISIRSGSSVPQKK